GTREAAGRAQARLRRRERRCRVGANDDAGGQNGMSAPKRTAPVEPVLDAAIQGIAAPGFFKSYQTLIGVNYPRTEKGVAAFQRAVASLDIADCTRTLQDRKAHRADPKLVAPPLIAVGFSYLGLVDLTPSATEMTSEAFKVGLPGRSALLGDPREGAGSPAH